MRAASRPPVAATSMRVPDFTGRSGDREPCEPRFWVPRCRLQVECALLSRRKYFLFRSSEPKNAFSPSQYSRSPDLPVNLDRTRWPASATEASAIQAAVWQPKMCSILSAPRRGSPRSGRFRRKIRGSAWRERGRRRGRFRSARGRSRRRTACRRPSRLRPRGLRARRARASSARWV